MSESENREAGEDQLGNPEGPDFLYDLKSAREAADLLRVSESTVWRYADQNILPAYRIGPKTVRFRGSDLKSLVYRVPRRKSPTTMMKKRLRLTPMSEGGRPAADAMTRAKEIRERILARRGGVPVSESWEDINAAREERTADL